MIRPGADGEGRAVQRAKVPRQAGRGVDRSFGAKRVGRVRISAQRGRSSQWARHHALNARDPEQCLSERACETTVRLSICAGQRSKAGIEKTGSGARTFGGAIHVREEWLPVRGRCPYRLLAPRMRPEGRGRRLADPDSGEEEGDRVLVQRARGAAPGTSGPTSRASARRPRPARHALAELAPGHGSCAGRSRACGQVPEANLRRAALPQVPLSGRLTSAFPKGSC